MSDRDKAKLGEFGGPSLVSALILGGIATAVSHSKKKDEKNTKTTEKNAKIQAEMIKINNQIQSINSQIADINRQIDNYKQGLIGSLWYSTEIEELEKEKRSLVQERTKYEELLNKYQSYI